ncbi:hypothetical protein EJ02DRAFT_346991 [Clathrospora elynae]|uniref:Ubiquitin-like domain-containing protein n=1 Tax=Clathrospora elynae TaxID=706981 RepID=A0A6A5ST82_9PLEO|nr:hypothetical protein EJ02DRAFT_346991 [Clathrospora elynae]
MSAIDATKPVDLPQAGTVEPAPVLASDNVTAPIDAPATEELPKTESEAVPLVEDKKEEKIVEPIYSGVLGYKAPGLKNAFRFAKKYFWFGEEPVPADNLREYLRGEKPEVAHPVVAWSSQTGKGLLFFVKHADHKEHPAGALNLAYATDVAKDGAIAFAFKISGHKHTFEAQTAAERDGWFTAVERAITEAKAAKDGIESSDGYKEHKENIAKPVILAGAASASAPKKSMDAAPKLAEAEAPVAGEPVVTAPARTGSASSSSSNEEKKAKKAKNKSRSVSRKRASIFGGLLGKKDKEPKEDSEAAKTEPEVKKDETAGVPHLDEIPHSTPVNTNDVVNPGEESKVEATPAPVLTAPVEENKTEETQAALVSEKPKPTKRSSIFGSFVEKLKSPTTEKRENEVFPASVKESEPLSETSKPFEETQVGAPVVPETAVSEPKTEDVKPVVASTPSKEKSHFSFGKVFGSKDRAKSPAATDKAPEPKVDAAPKIEDTPAAAPAVSESAEPLQTVEPVHPVAETKPEHTVEGQENTPKTAKKSGGFFGNLSRSLSKATGSKTQSKDKKDTVTSPATVEETSEETPVVADKDETPVLAAPAEKTIGDVPATAVSVGEDSKSTNPIVSTTAPSDDNPPAVRAHSSSRNITAPSTRPNSIPSPRASQAAIHPAHSRQDRPNSPLKRIPAAQRSRLPHTLASPSAKSLGDSANPTWTRSRLEKEREDWWDTQVTGLGEIWGAIRLAAQHLQAGELQEAQTMLEVTGCTCPTGLLWRGVFDETGVQYKVPEWIVVEPEGVAGEEEDGDATGAGVKSSGVVEADGGDGKGEETYTMRVRTSHDQKDLLVSVRRKETVGAIVERMKKYAELPPHAKIRLAYGGRIYTDPETLEAHPYFDYANNFVLSALVFL